MLTYTEVDTEVLGVNGQWINVRAAWSDESRCINHHIDDYAKVHGLPGK